MMLLTGEVAANAGEQHRYSGMHGEVRMVKYMHSVLSVQWVHSVCTILSIYSLHYVRVSDVCSVAGDTWMLSIQP